MLITAEKMNAINVIASRGLIKTAKAHTKQEAIWHLALAQGEKVKGHAVPSDDVLGQYWHIGQNKARDLWKSLGFENPEPEVYDSSFAGYVPTQTNDDDETPLVDETDPLDTEDRELESHLRHVVDEADGNPLQKHSQTINVPNNGSAHKSTLVSLFIYLQWKDFFGSAH